MIFYYPKDGIFSKEGKHIKPSVLVNFEEVKHIDGGNFAKGKAYLGQKWVIFSHFRSILRPKLSFSICFEKKTCCYQK